MFQELKDYKDSIAQLSEAEFEQELTTSDVFAEWESLAGEYIDTLLESGYASGEYSYSAQERMVTILMCQSEAMDAGIDFANLSPELLASWVAMVEDIDTVTNITHTTFADNSYSIDCQYTLTDSSGELLYSSVNGETTYTCVDVESAMTAAQEALYLQVVELVDSEQYQTAYDFWNNNNADGFYTLDYKDLSDYYYYAEALKNYDESQPIMLNSYLWDLKKVTSNFKDTDERITSVKAVIQSLNGTYFDKNGEYRIVISGDMVQIDLWNKLRNISSFDYTKHSSADGISWAMQNGIPQYAEVDCFAWIFKLTPISNGMNVEVTTRTGEYDANMSGTYTKQL
ncbi:MAG: hypothetical protein LIO57_06965 [Oscillospiraceae bacterium]|nr:hypothetical protein [Oscillospiraceae bacterium]